MGAGGWLGFEGLMRAVYGWYKLMVFVWWLLEGYSCCFLLVVLVWWLAAAGQVEVCLLGTMVHLEQGYWQFGTE